MPNCICSWAWVLVEVLVVELRSAKGVWPPQGGLGASPNAQNRAMSLCTVAWVQAP